MDVRLARVGQGQKGAARGYPALGLAAARVAADEARARVRQGLPPLEQFEGAQAQPSQWRRLTVKGLLGTYMRRHVTPTAKDPDQIEWVIDRLLAPIHDQPAADLTRADITRFLDAVTDERGGPSAYRAGSVLRAAFRFATKRGDVTIDPTHLLSLPSCGKPRARVLSEGEIAAVWRTAVPAWSRLVRVLLLSGLRLREAADAPAGEIVADVWNIPPERMKGGRAHVVPLCRALREEIGDLSEARWLFRSPRRFDQPVSGFTRGLRAVQAASGTSDDWTWHDLRRSAASGLQRIGAPFEVIESALAHRRQGVSAVYQRHEYLVERRLWLDRWAAHCVAGVTAHRLDSEH